MSPNAKLKYMECFSQCSKIVHHTEKTNQQVIQKLSNLVSSEEFLKELAQEIGNTSTNEDDEEDSNDQTSQENNEQSDEDIDEEGEDDMDGEMKEDEGDNEDDDKFDEEFEQDEDEDEELERYLDDQDEEEEMKDQIKIPSDLEDDDEDEFGDDAKLDDEGEEFDQFKDEMGDDFANEDNVFQEANDRDEMDLLKYAKEEPKNTEFTNKEMLSRIQKIEDQMIGSKSWHLLGEIQAKERPMNSLLEVHLDFNVASKLPPQITQEKTNGLEAVIKQRIMDELFDDPIRKYIKGRKEGDDEDQMDFTKSKRGLGEQYEDDYRKKLVQSSDDPNSFLRGSDILSGADSTLKKEISELMRNLFNQLDQLSNFNYVPRVSQIKEATISTQNVPALMIEESLPIQISQAQTKSARETFSIHDQKLREKTELTKEERRKERATRKRKIKTHLHKKELVQKEKKREMGVGMLVDRFAMKDIKRKQDKKKKMKEGAVDEKDSKSKGGNKNEMKSSKFFKRMDEVVKSDAAKKESKKRSKLENTNSIYVNHDNKPSKRFKL
ncbi:UNKNOWN [Stylonychia lemnae]|uniref:Uncharacterized protein n=1 Tax=Stylonychia lemnae TaxID=5949 RepID=A0A078AC89_STYLE|nr:UNKNOWN [Stylonychia lemnae]|eukprot:CDW79839.1 UNKNOWN [Stylonychia lemnae]